jgi:alpha-amylase/alpha-mannosidase (GH57 family)
VRWECQHGDHTREAGEAVAAWQMNSGANSFWSASLGPFRDGDTVTYTVHGSSGAGAHSTDAFTFHVRPALSLALLWHQHQPLYRDPGARDAAGSYLQPWVRLHALRDYYAMPAIAAEHGVHVTFNLTPVLLRQIDDYVEGGATDRALELTKRRAERLNPSEVGEILATFFDADWHYQIYPHARYRALLSQRIAGDRFSTQDVRDLQMWFSLAWFGHEFRTQDVRLVTGDTSSVKRFVEQQRDFSQADVDAMVGEQYKILRAVVPLHRHLQERGCIEVSTTPAFHPILPLLIDTDRARLDRVGARLPERFAHPEDAEAQIELAIGDYVARFGRAPTGMWPAEGAVSDEAAKRIATHGIKWLATDRGVLARSGKWGYDVNRASVLCQPYKLVQDDGGAAIFFRDTALSDAIGFDYQRQGDPRAAVDAFMRSLEERFLRPLEHDDEDRVLTIVLDGENAWGAYADDGRPFLHTLYERIAADPRLRSVTFSEYVSGSAERGVPAHAIEGLAQVHELATGSWIDEAGSAPGVDLGTWIGEAEENLAWNLLSEARRAITLAPGKTDSLAKALSHVYAAEGSDWFWWFGGDQESRDDSDFDDLFRRHLREAYRAAGLAPPPPLDDHIVPHRVVWTFTRPVDRIACGDLLTVRTNCPGHLVVRVGADGERSLALAPAGGVMAGARRFHVTIGPFASTVEHVTFRFHCEHPGCTGGAPCCLGLQHQVLLGSIRSILTRAPSVEVVQS